MATIPTITVPNTDAADVLSALERQYKPHAINFFSAGDPTGYNALTGPQQARECIKAALRILTRNYRRELAEQAVTVAEVEVT